MNELDKTTRDLLEKAPLEEPSKNFTASVMNQIMAEESPALVYKPLLSKRLMMGLAAAFIGMIAVNFLFADPAATTSAATTTVMEYLGLAGEYITGIFSGNSISPPIVWGAMGVLAIATLDMFLSRNKVTSHVA